MSKQNKQDRSARAAAALEERRRKERTRQVLTVVGVVVAMVLIVGGGFLVNSLRDNSSETAADAPTAGSDLGLTIGPDTAPHKVVVYEDFICPFCGELEKQTHSELEQLATDGKVQVEYRPFPLLTRFGPYSEMATAAFGVTLKESGPDVALAFHDLLYANQPDEEGPFPSEDDVADLMSQAGADGDAVTAFRDGDGESYAKDAGDAAASIGVQSTPTVIVDGKPFTDGRTVDELAANLLKAVS